MRSPLRSTLAGLFALAVVVTPLTTPGVASAHAALVSTDPANGAKVSRGPEQVSATFNEELQTSFAAMTVVGPQKHLWSTGETRVHATTASVALRPLGPAGTYTVNFRVTSADGHVVTGSWSFELSAAGTGTPGPTVNEGADAAPAIPPRSAERDDMPMWPFAAGTVAIVAVGLWLNRKRS